MRENRILKRRKANFNCMMDEDNPNGPAYEVVVRVAHPSCSNEIWPKTNNCIYAIYSMN